MIAGVKGVYEELFNNLSSFKVHHSKWVNAFSVNCIDSAMQLGE